MHIKIKHIKQTLLISACIFLAGFNYFTFVQADDASSDKQVACNKSIDNDCDGLTNSEEKLYATNANEADTDNDGYSDGVEVKSGYDPNKPAPGDRISTLSSKTELSSNTTNSDSLTVDIVSNLQSFIKSRDGQTISSTDINTFVAESISEKSEVPTLETLPLVEKSTLKIADQSYVNMSSDERKKQLESDARKYLSELTYIIIANSPKAITTKEELSDFNQDFMLHVSSLSSTNPDYAYFQDLGTRLEIIISQANTLTIPETMADMHIKMIRIIKGFLSLKDDSSSENDPLSKMILISKIQALTKISTDFIGNDFASYLKQF